MIHTAARSHQPDSERRDRTQHQLDEHEEIREYLRDQKTWLEAKYSQPQIITDNDDLGKLLTIAQAFQGINHFEINQLHLGRKVLPEHLVIAQGQQQYAIVF